MLLRERNCSEKTMAGMNPTLQHSGKGKAMELVKGSLVSVGACGERQIGGAKDLRTVDLLRRTVSWYLGDTVPLSRSTEYTTSTVNPSVNHGLQLIIRCR